MHMSHANLPLALTSKLCGKVQTTGSTMPGFSAMLRPLLKRNIKKQHQDALSGQYAGLGQATLKPNEWRQQ